MITGIDISQTAIEKARRKFPELSNYKGDLTKENPFTHNHEHLTMSHKQFDRVVIKEVLWYVCHNLEYFIKNVLSMIKKEGFLYVSQSFPESHNWVGKDVIDSPEKLKEIFFQYSKPVHYCVEWDWNFNGRPLVHFLGKLENYADK